MAKKKTTVDVEEVSGRGPTDLHYAFAKWLNEQYGGDHDPMTVYLAQTRRTVFRKDPNSGYAELAEGKAGRKENRKARAKAKEEPELEDELAPRRKKKAKATEEVPAKKTKPKKTAPSESRPKTKKAKAKPEPEEKPKKKSKKPAAW